MCSYNATLHSKKINGFLIHTTTWIMYWMEEAWPKGSTLFNTFIWTWGTRNLVDGDRNQNIIITLLGRGHAQTFWGAKNILYLDKDVGCMCTYLCKNSSNSTLKISILYVLKIYSINKGGIWRSVESQLWRISPLMLLYLYMSHCMKVMYWVVCREWE